MSSTASGATSPVSNGASTSLDDIEYLLRLEAIKRFNEDEKNIRRQVEEKSRQLLEAKQQYLMYYEKYTAILKLIGTRHVLESKSQLDDSMVNTVEAQINEIVEKITSDLSTVHLDEGQLKKCKSKLSAFKDYANLSKQQKELSENRDTIRCIQNSAEIVETTLEASTLLSMQQLVTDVKDENLMPE